MAHARSRPLSPDLIARTAAELGDREGAEAMTMRRIARELGCDPMALYRHFAHREALLDAVADLAVAEVADPGPERAWDARIEAIGHGLREAALRHPGITAHVAARPPLGDNGRRIATGVMGALLAAGLPPATAVRGLQALVAYLSSSLAMAVQAGAPDRRWEQVRDMMNALPGAAEAGEDLFVVGSADQFAFGLRMLLAGLRSELTAP